MEAAWGIPSAWGRNWGISWGAIGTAKADRKFSYRPDLAEEEEIEEKPERKRKILRVEKPEREEKTFEHNQSESDAVKLFEYLQKEEDETIRIEQVKRKKKIRETDLAFVVSKILAM